MIDNTRPVVPGRNRLLLSVASKDILELMRSDYDTSNAILLIRAINQESLMSGGERIGR